MEPLTVLTVLQPPSKLDLILRSMGRTSIHDVSDQDLARHAFAGLPIPTVYLEDSETWAVCQPTGIWSRDRASEILRSLIVIAEDWRRAAIDLRHEARLKADDKDEAKTLRDRAKACVDIAKKLESKWARDCLLPVAADTVVDRVMESDFDTDPAIIGVQNGAFDLRRGAFFQPTPADRISKVANASFNPMATCPTWLATLDEITGNLPLQDRSEMLDYLQCLAGRSALFEVGGRYFVFFGGPPGSGKSVFLNTLKRVLGDYAIALPTSSLMASKSVSHGPRPDLLTMMGARQIMLSEVEDTYTFDIAGIKRISGGDPIVARDVYKGNVTFDVGGLICMSGNTFPRMPSISDSFLVRLKIVMFDNPVPITKQDVALPDKLMAERDGILNWVLLGAMKVLRGEMQEPRRVRENNTEFRRTVDTIGMFINDCCDQSPKSSFPRVDLLSAYNEWAGKNGFRLYERNGGAFNRRIEELGFKHRRVSNVHHFVGLEVKGEFLPNYPYRVTPEPTRVDDSECLDSGRRSTPNYNL